MTDGGSGALWDARSHRVLVKVLMCRYGWLRSFLPALRLQSPRHQYHGPTR
jgi:hypothetical protein